MISAFAALVYLQIDHEICASHKQTRTKGYATTIKPAKTDDLLRTQLRKHGVWHRS
jgi:hypothetical protein